MVNGKKSKTYRKKDKKVKRRSKGLSGALVPITTTVQRGYLPFGNRYQFKLPYVFTNRLTTIAQDVAVSNIFNLNSCFDPDYSFTGHQPYQWDQLTPMYNRYRVDGCKYEVTINDPSVDGMWVGIVARHGLNAAGAPAGKDLTLIRERKMAKMQPLNDTGSQKLKLTGFIPMHKLLGLTKAQYIADTQTSASTGASPTTQVVMDIVLISPLGSPLGNVNISGKLTYYGQLYEYLSPTQS